MNETWWRKSYRVGKKRNKSELRSLEGKRIEETIKTTRKKQKEKLEEKKLQ